MRGVNSLMVSEKKSLKNTKPFFTKKTVTSYLDPSRPTNLLTSEEKEFQMVERHFLKMTKSLLHYIKSIDFITNPVLQQKFDAKKEEFKNAGIPHQGNLLKGIDKKIGRREIIEPIKRVFTYFLFSILTYYCYYYEETKWFDIAGFYILYLLI